ncbi:MAG: PKD domain-containing protein [Vicinamibacterales bacterium]
MWTRSKGIIALLALAAAAASCTVKDTEAPAVAGPSELALSVNVQASPDTVTQDGASTSTITIEARGPNSQPVSGVAVRLDMLVDDAIVDFGTLSTKTVTTGSDGRGRVVYTTPPRPLESVGYGTRLTLLATPVGTDARGAVARQVDIRVLPPGVILPPNGEPVAEFTFSPQTPQAFTSVLFDASSSSDEGVRCGNRCSYQWTFGDGDSGSGETVSHEFRAAGSYVVTLRVIDQGGKSSQKSATVTVAVATPPTASFVYSPTAPRVSQPIFFTAEASRAANGRRIVAYDWNFGSGRTGVGVTISKQYDTPGTYVVTLTVTDDAFQQSTVTQSVTVIP